MMIPNPTRWTPWLYFFPQRYIDTVSVAEIDFPAWSDRYEWRQDGWNGLKDFAQPVQKTIETEEGDCEDYALVAASEMKRRGAESVYLGFCFKTYAGIPVPRHVVAASKDGADNYQEEVVFSSGRRLYDTSKEQYVGSSQYQFAIWREI